MPQSPSLILFWIKLIIVNHGYPLTLHFIETEWKSVLKLYSNFVYKLQSFLGFKLQLFSEFNTEKVSYEIFLSTIFPEVHTDI